MFFHYRTQCLILKKENQGEADQLFCVFCKNFGKLEILGKSIRKISSKLRQGAEIGAVVLEKLLHFHPSVRQRRRAFGYLSAYHILFVGR